MAIAIIPARKGSKRIADKNIKSFFGVPMIVRTIELLKKSNLFDRIEISTDSEEYASIARNSGIEVNKLRPEYLSNDKVGIKDVMKYEIASLGLGTKSAVEVMCVFPCTPFLKLELLDQAFKTFKPDMFDLIFPVLKLNSQLNRSFRLGNENSLIPISEKNLALNTQDFEELYQDAGQFYLGTTETWFSSSLSKFQGIVISKLSAVDIDEEEDWKLAEALYLSNKQLNQGD